MVKLGISVYPEQVSLEEIRAYCQTAASYGFTKVFSSMFSVQGDKDALMGFFREFSQIAHAYNMEVATDVNPEVFKRLNTTIEDLSVFKEMGIDTIRMDLPFGDTRDVKLINNVEGIKIELTAISTEAVEKAIAQGANVDNLVVCHNFYPQRFTGLDLDHFNAINTHWKSRDVRVAAFVSSQVENSHGPWPVKDGLPTVEDHRKIPLDLQVRHMMALGNVDEVLIGNAFASEDELRRVKETVDDANTIVREQSPLLDFLLTLAPNFGKRKIILDFIPQQAMSELEAQCLFGFKMHSDLGDGTRYMLRSRFTRGLKENVEKRVCEKPFFTRGDVVIVNETVAHYQGEIQIVLKDMENDGQRNLLGVIRDDNAMLIDYIEAGDVFSFRK